MNLSNILFFNNRNNNDNIHTSSSNILNLSSTSNRDRMVENIHNQIQRIRKNEQFDEDTKESKIEKLQEKLQEIAAAERENKTESLNSIANYEDRNNTNSNEDKNSNIDGDTLELSIDTKSLIQAEIGLQNMRNSHSTKVTLQGGVNILESEIRIDRSRGVDTTNKESQLSRKQEGINKLQNLLGQYMQKTNQTVADASIFCL